MKETGNASIQDGGRLRLVVVATSLPVVARGLGSGKLEDHRVGVIDRLGSSYQRELCRSDSSSV